jgi:cytochrome c553
MKKPSLSFSILLSLASLTSLAQAQTQAPAQGAKPAAAQADITAKAAMCTGCHNIPGYQASFPQVHKVPMIAGQSAAYIQSALAAYKQGDRKHPSMRALATTLSDKDMADLGAFYEKLPKDAVVLPAKPQTAPSPEVAALLQKGNCASCHGDNFSKGLQPAYPKIAGQHADYLYVALKAYQTDNNASVGRNNAIMGGMAKLFTPAELKLMANYISSLPGDLRVAPQPRFR